MKKIFFAAVALLMSAGAMAQGTVKFFIDDFSIAQGEKKTISVNLTNPDNKFTGFQFNLTLPEGITVDLNKKGKPNVSLNEDRIEDQTVSSSLNNGVYTVLSFSMTSSDLYDTEGALVYLPVTAAADAAKGSAEGSLTNVKLSPKSGTSVTFDKVPFKVTIGDATAIEYVKAGADVNAPAYNLAGQKVNKNYKGVVIQNGKKIAVK